jgi:adenosylcobyric acid synthase
VTHPDEIDDTDLVLIPGTRATVDDLDWLRARGLADAIVRRARGGGQTIGVCGGYQMLARRIRDGVESRRGEVPGLGLLPVDVTFDTVKTLRRSHGTALGAPVAGYEIHHGVVRVDGAPPFLDGCVDGAVWGTTWHGVFENDEFRRVFLEHVARAAGRRYVASTSTSFAALRTARLDALGDLVEEHLDTDALLRLIENGAPPGLPSVVTALR